MNHSEESLVFMCFEYLTPEEITEIVQRGWTKTIISNNLSVVWVTGDPRSQTLTIVILDEGEAPDIYRISLERFLTQNGH